MNERDMSGRRDDEMQTEELWSALEEGPPTPSFLFRLRDRVCPPALDKLLNYPDFIVNFMVAADKRLDEMRPPSVVLSAYVLSVDIRRSTELMLSALKPEMFASFLIDLDKALWRAVISRYGFFDKFTGDGMLAFFPEIFHSQALEYVLDAARECHAAFDRVYDRHRESFKVVPVTGLGIGIDYGYVSLVFAGAQFTVVGHPVVHACRLAGTKACSTLMNEQARVKLVGPPADHCTIQDTTFEIKHSGPLRVCSVTRRADAPQMPLWSGAAWEPATKAGATGTGDR